MPCLAPALHCSTSDQNGIAECRQGEEELVNVRRAVGNLNAQKAAAKAHKREGEADDGGEKRKKGRVGRVKNRRVPKKAPAAKGKVTKKGSGKRKR